MAIAIWQPWFQGSIRDSEAVYNLRMAALELSRGQVGPISRTVDMEINLGDFTSSIR